MPTMNDFFNNFTPGVFSGVASGLVLAVFFWLRDLIRQRRERKDQVTYISALTVKFRNRIFETTEGVTFKGTGQGFSKHYIRKLHFESFLRELESVLAGRSSRLTFEETQEVNDIFLELHTLHRDFIPDEQWYSKRFEQAASINWLSVTPRCA